MKRVLKNPRDDWRAKCESVGFSFYDLPSEGGESYWRETVAYEITYQEVLQLERETQEIFDRCMDAVEHIVRNRRFNEFHIPEQFWDEITRSWDEDDPTVYGRFDLAWQPGGRPAKVLEFNADTPTSLVESAAAQWWWMKDVQGETSDQFNSIHEKLIAQWHHIRTKRWNLPEGAPLITTSLHSDGSGNLMTEDFDTVQYMAETARAAGFAPRHVFLETIKWSERQGCFVDENNYPLRHIFKLYPWEWMMREDYAPYIISAGRRIQWVEPVWKALLSNKQLLVILWELFPDHPNFLPTYPTPEAFPDGSYVKKPIFGREGGNVTIVDASGTCLEKTTGTYGAEGFVYQQYCPLPVFDGMHAVLGSWVIGDEPAGIDFRETSTRISGDLAFFVPHYIAI